MKNKILFAIFAAILLLVTAFAASAQEFTITSTPATTATVGQAYSYQMTASTSGVSFGTISGPDGFSVNTAGLFTWIPSTAGIFPVTLYAVENDNASNIKYQTFNINVNTGASSRMLSIEEVRVDVNGKKEDTLSSPGTIDYDAELGDDITLKVTVQNNFNVENDETTIRSIDMEISSDIDEADGLDDGISRLEASDDDDMTVSFSIDPEDVDPSDAPFDITIEVTGETEDGTVYSDSWTLRLDMETKSRDLYMYNVEVSAISFTSCQDNTIRITGDLKNIGTRDLDNAALRFKISDLGINKFSSEFELETGDEDSFSESITIPKGITEGTYVLEIDAFPQRTSSTSTSETAYAINIIKCTSGSDSEDEEENDSGSSNNGQGTVIIPDVSISGTPVASAVGKKGLFDSSNSLYLVLLAVLAVLLITIIVLIATRIRD